MKDILLNIWEAIRFTYFFKHPKTTNELEEVSTKTQKELEEESDKSTRFFIKDYDNTVKVKYIFLTMTILCLLAAFWFSFVVTNFVVSILFVVLSFLLAKLYVNRRVYQTLKYSFIQFDISVSVELEKAKNPDYQMREPGFYEDNF